jgi:N utilization substance protein B
MAARHKARKRALDVLYAADLRGEQPLDALARIVEDGGELTNPYSEVLVRGTTERGEEIDGLLRTYAQGWTLERMPAVDRNVLRIGVWEILYGGAHEVPAEVAVSEAVLLVRELSTDESPGFVNGVLDAIRREASPASA